MTAEHSLLNGAGSLSAGNDLDPQLIVSAALAIAHSDHQVHCGLSISSPNRTPETITSTDDLPVRVDWLQHELRQGPGVNPVRGKLLQSKDLAVDPRWPDFGKLCLAVLNLRSMVSIQVPMPAADGARLNFYSSEPAGLDRLDVVAAIKLAQLAVPSVGNALREFRATVGDRDQRDHSRIAVALGTVMARYRVSSARAFDLLLQAGGELDRSLLEVAFEVARSGQLPDVTIGGRQKRRENASRGEGGTSQTDTRAWVRKEAGQARVPEPRATPSGTSRSDPPAGHSPETRM